MGRTPGLLAALALLFALATTPLWSDAVRIAESGGLSYAERRDRFALGFPGAEVEQLLARELPRAAPIALGRGLQRERVRQRLTELLYPRAIDAESPSVLERAQGTFALRGASPPEGGVAPVRAGRGAPPLPALAGALATLVVGGLGALLVRAARALAPSAALPWRAAPLLGIAGVGVIASLATWLELPLLTRGAFGVALAAAAAVLVACRRELASGLRALF